MKTYLVTGGAGFIGTNFIKYILNNKDEIQLINLDNITYAGNINNLIGVDHNKYKLIKGDICDIKLVEKLFKEYNFDSVVHFAAETHVDRSIDTPAEFIRSNIVGVFNLLEVFKEFTKKNKKAKLIHISTDEVYGDVLKGRSNETDPYKPSSPYAASKASSDHLVYSYVRTFKINAVITNCSNNYGPHQHQEKLIPMTIKNIKEKKQIPIYGKGDSVRDWIFVLDHINAIDIIFHNGQYGETYNIGANNELENINLVEEICKLIDKKTGTSNSKDLISFVTDRPGHDMRYAIDSNKIMSQLNWRPKYSMQKGLELTIDWYLQSL